MEINFNLELNELQSMIRNIDELKLMKLDKVVLEKIESIEEAIKLSPTKELMKNLGIPGF
jgi:hypothetical protein